MKQYHYVRALPALLLCIGLALGSYATPAQAKLTAAEKRARKAAKQRAKADKRAAKKRAKAYNRNHKKYWKQVKKHAKKTKKAKKRTKKQHRKAKQANWRAARKAQKRHFKQNKKHWRGSRTDCRRPWKTVQQCQACRGSRAQCQLIARPKRPEALTLFRRSRHPAFAGASFERRTNAWRSGGRPLAAKSLRCGPTRARGSKSQDLSLPGGAPLASLGGDYWHVPFPGEQGGTGGIGRCVLRPSGAEAARGIESLVFDAHRADRFISFLARGTGSLQVELLRGRRVAARHTVKLAASRTMRWYSLPLPGRRGLRIRVRADRGAKAIELDAFVLSAHRAPAGSGVERTPARVWGFADLQVHLFAELGFGGRMFAGQTHSSIGRDGQLTSEAASDPQKALRSCQGNHGRFGKEGVTLLLPDSAHNATGYPDFKGWPTSREITHVNTYVDWLKRAWQGGLRLIQLDVVHNAIFPILYDLAHPWIPGPRNLDGRKIFNDHFQIEKQIRAAKNFARLPDVRGWAEIATTPQDAERIVRSGKLAMVLGIEIDDLGDFMKKPQFVAAVRAKRWREVRQRIAAYLQELWNLGVRHVIPIHVFDNIFGGAAYYDPTLDAGQYIYTHEIAKRRGTWPKPRQWVNAYNAWGTGAFNRTDFFFKDLDKMLAKIRPILKYAAPGAAAVPAVMAGIAAIPGFGPLIIGALTTAAVAAGVGMAVFIKVLPGIIKLFKALLKDYKLVDGLGQRLRSLPTGGDLVAHANRLGLTAAGEILIQELMKKGFLIDIAHCSDKAAHRILDMGIKYRVPIHSSHTGLRELKRGWHIGGVKRQLGNKRTWTDAQGVFWKSMPNFDEEKCRKSRAWCRRNVKPWNNTKERMERFDTHDPTHLASERALSPSQIAKIRQTGGVVGIGMGHNNTPLMWKAPGRSQVRPDCDGSSKAWAQDYLYTVDKMGGQGIAFGTDINGWVAMPGPRFGPRACQGRKAFTEAQAHAQLYRRGRLVGGTAVNYDHNLFPFDPKLYWESSAIRSHHQGRFRVGAFAYNWGKAMKKFKGAGAYPDVHAQNFWIALTIVRAGKADRGDKVPFPKCKNRGKRGQRAIARVAYGIRRALLGQGRPKSACNKTDTASDAKAAYDAVVGRPSKHPAYLHFRRVWQEFQAVWGTNPPLRKSIMGRGSWDFNFDGFAHYGMLPDLLQDVRNVGVSPRDLAPLFNGAADYIEMWNKVERAKRRLKF